jgi:hypothetical protein
VPRDSIYLFIDESGDLLPYELGSSNLVLAAFATTSPNLISSKINELRYQLLSSGVGISNFHAADDSRVIRSEFLRNLIDLPDCMGISIGVQKAMEFTITDVKALYIKMLLALVKEIVKASELNVTLIILIDLTLDRTSRSEAKRVLKSLCRNFGIKNYIYFQSMKSDGCGQIADYLAWSHFQSLERENPNYLFEMKRLINAIEIQLDDPPG